MIQNLKDLQLSLSIRLFLIVTFICIVSTLLYPHWWIWTLSLVIIFHFLLSIAGLFPRSKILGSNWNRLPLKAQQSGEIAITIDDGPNPEITPQVLNILSHYQAKATFFCIGKNAEQYPNLCQEIIRQGHSIENHSQHHYTFFSLFGPTRIHKEIMDGQLTLQKISGRKPAFFRPTAGLRNPFLDPILTHLGLQLASWTRRGFDTRISDPDIVFKKLANNLAAGDILLLHDGNTAKSNNGQAIILNVLPRLLELIAQKKLNTILLHSRLE